jgi:lysozyme family protein
MDLKAKNKQRWDDMHISAAKGPLFKAVADRLIFQKPRYEAVSKALAEKGYTIPWEFIAVAHQREASGDFTKYLGNGQVLTKKTTIVPKGRGPFASWEEGAIDALLNAAPYAAKNKDWSIGGTLTKLEEYNGLGYAAKGLPSPYVWAGTDQYKSGKYIRDGVYDGSHVDTQLGCAGLLKFMGYGAATKTAPAVAATAGVAVATGGVAAVLSNQTAWDYVNNHLLAFGIGGVFLAIFVGLMIYAHNNKEKISVQHTVD